MPKSYKKKMLQVGRHLPRNDGERLYYEKYGTITPIPYETQIRKNAVQVCCILYIHHGMQLKEAAKLAGVYPNHAEICRKADRWDEFAQELAQMTKPSNLTLIKAHDYEVIDQEHKRREKSLPQLRAQETKILKALDDLVPGSKAEQVALSNLKAVRAMIGDVTGYDDFRKEMSAARQMALVSMAKEAGVAKSPRAAKGKILDI